MTMTTSSSDELREMRERQSGAPLISSDVPFEIARLRAERTYETDGHADRTLTRYPDLRVVLEAMKTGVRLPFQEPPERATLQVIVGQLRLWLEHGDNFDLAEGSFAAIEAGRIHEIECLDECAFMLTLAWPPSRSPEGEVESDGAGI